MFAVSVHDLSQTGLEQKSMLTGASCLSIRKPMPLVQWHVDLGRPASALPQQARTASCWTLLEGFLTQDDPVRSTLLRE
jgi:hypothetical protein